MPSVKAHRCQLQHNLGFLHEPVFDPNQTHYYDWSITVYFYIVIHLIEGELACNKRHPANHRERFLMMMDDARLADVLNDYTELYNMSIRSRYYCQGIHKLDLLRAKLLYRKIHDDLSGGKLFCK